MAGDDPTPNPPSLTKFEKNLFQAYQLAQEDVPSPDVTITLGDCKWKVHSQLLASESIFFKKTLEGDFKEATSKEIFLHDDDPRMIGRIIQYLYLKKWDVRLTTPYLSSTATTLLSIMRPNPVNDEFDDLPGGSNAEEHTIHYLKKCVSTIVKMINTADKYLMKGLINAIPKSDTWKHCLARDEYLVEELLKSVTYEQIANYVGLKDAVVSLVSTNLQLVKHPDVQKSCSQDYSFAKLIIDKCIADRDYWKKKANDLESQISKK